MRHLVRSSTTGFSITAGIVVGISLVGCHKETPVASANAPAPAVTDAQKARRSVKATTDADAASIDQSVKDTTIEDLVKNKPDGELGTRQAPFETSVWRVKATVESIELKKDGDYYMVLRGDNGGQSVVEVPDPKTCAGSPFVGQITATRKALEEKYHPTSEKKDINEKATITGVGFLGFSNNAKKKGSNGITGARLMPGTDIKFDGDKDK
ncbi:MAG: hypothetical protein JST51_07330 [Armatimonadetes bacterium]|nr:hypothetical protein [Armatimonadota bacterium]